LAGSGSAGSTDANGTSASFNLPFGVAEDASGNVYVTDFNNNKIRKIASNGDVTTLAGSGSVGSTDANGTSASFNAIQGVAVDALGNVYVADRNNHKIRKIASNGDVTTLAGSGSAGSTDANGSSASFNLPFGVAVDASGNVYVADYNNHKIRKISDPSLLLTGSTTGQTGSHSVVLAANDGNGGITEQPFTVVVSDVPSVTTSAASAITANSATLNGAVTSDGAATITERGFVYSVTATDATPTVAESSGANVTKVVVTGTTGTFSETLTGLTTGTSYSFAAYATNSVGTTEGSVLTFTPINVAPTYTSTPITAIEAGNTYTYTITTDDAEGDNVTITATTKPAWLSLATSTGGDVTTLAGSGSAGSTDANGTNASFNSPNGVALDASGNVYVADPSNHKIRNIAPNGDVTTLAGSGGPGSADANGTDASFTAPSGVAVDASGNVYVADRFNHKIRKIAPNGDVTTLAGTGSAGSTDANGSSASFNFPWGVAVDALGNVIVADWSNHKIRKIAPNGDVTTLAGSGSAGSTDANGTSASFYSPRGVAVDASGNVFVADQNNHKIRKIAPNGDVITLAGSGNYGSTDANGTSASFKSPTGVAVDVSGNVYVADLSNHKIRKITPNGDVTTLAGSGNAGSTDANGTSASFNQPHGVTVDVSGNVYVADASNHKIRKILGIIQLKGNTTGNVGSHPVVLEANDGNGGVTEQSFTVVVSSVLPTVTSSDASAITAISATLNGAVTSDGAATITERGFVYSVTATDATPTVAESSGANVTKVVVTGTTGAFSEVLSGLTAATGYSFAAYATNSVGTTESSVLTFTTPALTTPTITFAAIDKVYGDTNFVLGATSNSAGTITYSIVGAANGTILSGTNNEDVALGNAGTITIRATQAADGIYSATTKDITLTITTKAITVTADVNQTKVFGAVDPTFTYTLTTGVLETGDAFTGALSRVAGEDVGTYAITVGTLSAGANYNMTFVGADFSITAKAITVTADVNQTKVYGAADPTFTYTVTSGVLETGDAFTGTQSRAAGEDVGTYAITVGTLSAGANYNMTFVGADFSITAKAITVTADVNQTKVFGDADPTFTYAVTSGALEIGDAFTGALSRAAGEDVGAYAITVGTLSAGANYSIDFISDNLTITKKTLNVLVDNKTKVYGESNPALTQIITGYVNNDDEASLTSVPTVETIATSASSVGDYEIISSGGLAANYSFNFVSGTLSVTKAVLTATADNHTIVFGDAIPSLTITYSGFVNGDDISALTTEPTVSTIATDNSDAGSYDVILTGGSAINYNITLNAGTLTINKADQVISMNTIADKDINIDVTVEIVASSTSGLTVELSVVGPATLSGTTLTLDGTTGTVTVTASQAGDNNYNVATDVSVSFNVIDPCADFSVVLASTTDVITGNDGAADITVTGGTTPYEFSWSNGATTEDLTNVVGGNYTVTIADASGCTQTLEVAVGDIITGTEQDIATSIIYYPNPVNNHLTIQATFRKATVVVVEIIDLSGRVLINENYESTSSLNASLDMSKLTSGQYLITITTDMQKQIERITISK